MSAGVLAGPFVVDAQQTPTTVQRIGWVFGGDQGLPGALVDAFAKGLAEFGGLTVGHNVSIEYRRLPNALTPAPEVVADLVRANVAVIVAGSGAAALSAKRATAVIPIVMIGVRDPVEQGFVTSLSRPAGNITGVTAGAGPQIAGKRLELMKETLPHASRVGHLWGSAFPGAKPHLDEMVRAADRLLVAIHSFDVVGPEALPNAFAEMKNRRIGILSVEASLQPYRRRIVELAAQSKLPAMYGTDAFVEDGGLMSYSADWREIYRKGGQCVARILGGAKPADLPIEQPTKFKFAINLKTAKALGLTIPPSLLLRADQVIE
jgi:putative ABC transport system substrate-binding protein